MPDIPRDQWVWYAVVDKDGFAWEIFHNELSAQSWINDEPNRKDFFIIKVKEYV